jgi:chromate reductase, NAD(P)H dehydrogenase (quinone)
MIHIIVGTNRPGSNSLKVAQIAKKRFTDLNVDTTLIELEKLPVHQLTGDMYGKKELFPKEISAVIESLNHSNGLYIVCPEYNGSMPGILKYFLDFWEYPKTFENRPVAFVGLGGRFGGLRPVEHLQQIFGYRNAYIFPERIFITNVWNGLSPNGLLDETLDKLWMNQIQRFSKFVGVRKLVDL